MVKIKLVKSIHLQPSLIPRLKFDHRHKWQQIRFTILDKKKRKIVKSTTPKGLPLVNTLLVISHPRSDFSATD